MSLDETPKPLSSAIVYVQLFKQQFPFRDQYSALKNVFHEGRSNNLWLQVSPFVQYYEVIFLNKSVFCFGFFCQFDPQIGLILTVCQVLAGGKNCNIDTKNNEIE